MNRREYISRMERMIDSGNKLFVPSVLSVATASGLSYFSGHNVYGSICLGATVLVAGLHFFLKPLERRLRRDWREELDSPDEKQEDYL